MWATLVIPLTIPLIETVAYQYPALWREGGGLLKIFFFENIKICWSSKAKAKIMYNFEGGLENCNFYIFLSSRC